jgi:GntR family transcriptional regulator/MocR family aminotransferase
MELNRIPVDDSGIHVDAVEALCKQKKIKAIYITSHHHYPTTVTLSAPRRIRLLALAEQYGFIILEDDYDYDYHYLSSPILPLASSDTKGMVVYIGTLSKTISPGMRTGYIIAPANLILELARLRQIVDMQGDPVLELALCDLFEDGTVKRLMKKALHEYRLRRDFLCENLAARFAGLIDFRIPDGGLAVWARFNPSHPLPQLSGRMKGQGFILPNGLIHNPGTSPATLNATRLGFGFMNIAECAKALDTLERIMKP